MSDGHRDFAMAMIANSHGSGKTARPTQKSIVSLYHILKDPRCNASTVSRSGFKTNPQRERGRFHARHPDVLAHVAGYVPSFETASRLVQTTDGPSRLLIPAQVKTITFLFSPATNYCFLSVTLICPQNTLCIFACEIMLAVKVRKRASIAPYDSSRPIRTHKHNAPREVHRTNWCEK